MNVLILGVNGFIGNALTHRITTTTDWHVYGMDLSSSKLEHSLGHPAVPLHRGGHHDQQGVDRVPRQEVRRGAAAGRHRHPGDLRQGAAAGLRARLRGEPADRPLLREVPPPAGLPLHLRGLRHVPGPGVRRELEPAGLRPDQQAALDLRLLQAAHGPRDRRLRPAGGAQVHLLPPVQLDRPQARRHLRRQGGLVARAHPVHRQPGDRRADPPGGRRRAEALLHLGRGRHRRPDADHREPRTASATARSSTSATRTTTARSPISRRSWRRSTTPTATPSPASTPPASRR